MSVDNPFARIRKEVPMYFSSDSWGKFLSNESKFLLDGIYTDAEITVLMKIVSDAVYDLPNKESQLELYQKILEVLQMPVVSPKPSFPGETDHVDLSLISKIIFEPETIRNLTTNENIRVSFQMNPCEENPLMISFQATFPDGSTDHFLISIQLLEEAMSNIIHHESSKRLEQTELIQKAINTLLSNYQSKMKKNGAYVASLGVNHDLNHGLGIIYDSKAEQDVGTFESVHFHLPKSGTETSFRIQDAFLSGRSTKEVSEEKGRFQYKFYNLKDDFVYIIRSDSEALLRHDQLGDCSLEYRRAAVVVDPIMNPLPHLPLIHKAQELKAMMENSDPADPLYQEEFEKFKQSRMDLIRSSQEKLKKQKMVSKFADIEL
jgi:hypothetical protein